MKKGRKIIYMSSRDTSKEPLLGQVFRQYEPALKRFLSTRLALEEDREEIIQEVFLKLSSMENLAHLVSRKSGSTKAYLFTIASNLVVDMQRRSARRVPEVRQGNLEAPFEADSPNPNPESVLDAQDQIDEIMAALDKLKPKCKRAFVLSRFHYLTYPEIAREMNLSVPSVERYITIALASMRERLKK